MRAFALFCGGMADQPSQALSGRTPLEVAKTPFIDSLVKKGRVGSANFVPRPLSVSHDVACMSILGYDPEVYYTGLAPLEALALKIPQDDRTVVFRSDFITVLDDSFVEVTRRLSSRESKLLIGELNSKLGDLKVRFFAGSSHEGFLLFKDNAASEDLDELECVPPANALGQKIGKLLPRGKSASLLKDVMDKAKRILEDHEINRVRIDLKENPASMIWPWGQGKKPKLPVFDTRTVLGGAVFSEVNYVKGLALSCGLSLSRTFSEAIEKDTNFIFSYLPVVPGRNDLMAKIRRIEEFDAQVVGPVCRAVEKSGAHRILIGTDLIEPAGKELPVPGDVPFLIQGEGVDPEPCERFCEKAALDKRFAFDEGHELMAYFLGKGISADP